MKRKIAVFIAAVAPLAIALTAAGCGGSGSGSSYSSGPYGSSVAASAPLASPPPRSRREIAAGSRRRQQGRKLYLFGKDRSRRSACYGRCTNYWPPLLTHGKPVALAGVKQVLLGTIRRANGSRQVTYAGHPLYRFIQDRNPGQTRGEGSQLFGAGWDVLSPAGKKIESDD
jgi:predicted lipoprotein with Yx(FWY)xxD motif